MLSCAAHPGARAVFACDSCARLLCPECVQEGHRLLFCRHCGERALPLDRREAATTTGRRKQTARRTAAGYSWGSALFYPLRGYGSFAFWGYLVASAVLLVIDHLLVFGGLITLLPGFLLGLVLAQFLFAIAYSTAKGENELPDWPDFDFWTALGRVILAFVVGLFSLLPAMALLAATDCTPSSILLGGGSLASCTLALAVGLFVGVGLWLLAFGATAVFDTPWLFFRADLHFKAALVAPADLFVATLLNGGLMALSPVLFVVVGTMVPVPILNSLMAQAVSLYALFLSAHFAGVYFRRNLDELERVYLE